MKISTRQIFLLIFLASATFSKAQTSKHYLQLGGGYLLHNQLEQLGFAATGPAVMAYAEVGKTFRPLSIGAQQTFLQEYSFYKYQLKQQIQTIYAKYSFNQYLEFLPYGLDPYAMIGASFITNRFQTFHRDNPSELINQEVISRPGYTFGAGLQAGIHRLIVGFYYQYTPGSDSFTLEDFETLPFATGTHLISLNIGVRLSTPEIRKQSKCPRFGGKGMLRF